MFMGQFEHTIDAKGRTIVPVKYREELGEEFVCTWGADGCLYLYPQEEWGVLVEKLRKENKALSDEVALRDKSLEEMGYELAQARNDYNSLMMAKMIEITDGDMESAQRRLAKLIREVNKCITLISEK